MINFVQLIYGACRIGIRQNVNKANVGKANRENNR